jgi:hypothetical protein
MAPVKAWPAVVSHKINLESGIPLLAPETILTRRFAERVGIAEFKYLPEPIATRLIVSVAMIITDLCVRVMLPVFHG